MHISNKKSASAFAAPHGETLYELLTSQQSDKHSVALVELQPKKASLKHYHPEMEETYYLLSGQARMVINDEEKLVQAGDLIFVPKQATHQIFNESECKVTYLAICAPAWHPDCSVFLENDET